MKIPGKLLKGQPFKRQTVQTVNQIIDYLQALTPVAGPGIRIDKKTNGFVINNTQHSVYGINNGNNIDYVRTHPFKVIPFEDETTHHHKLGVYPGRIFFTDCPISMSEDVWTNNYDDIGTGSEQGQTGSQPIDLTNVQPGEYMVMWGSMSYYDNAPLFKSMLFLINANNDTLNTLSIPNFPGFTTLQLAAILIEQKKIVVDDEELTVKRAVIQNQYLFDTQYIQLGVFYPWQTWACIDDQNESDIVKDLSLFKINKICIRNGDINVNSAWLDSDHSWLTNSFITVIEATADGITLDKDTYVYCYLFYRIKELTDGKEVEFLIRLSNTHSQSEQSIIDPDGTMKVYKTVLLCAYNLFWFVSIYKGGNLYFSKDYKTVCLSNIDIFSSDEEAVIDGYADILPNKLRGKEQSIEKPIINEKQPKTYVDFHITSGAQISDMGERIITRLSKFIHVPAMEI